ncbi:MAG: ATP-binding protein [Desulfitobacteriaceae bacterium]
MQIIHGKVESAQKVVVYGPEGIGKSTFLSKFPGIIFSDVEGSTKKLDVARTPKPSSWSMLLEQVRYFIKNPHKLNTFGLDTADWAEKLCAVELCAKSNKDGIEGFGYGKGYTYLSEEFGKLLNLLEELIEVGVNVVIAAHAFTRKFDQPDEMGSYDRWELKLTKYVAPMIREWADMVLFINYKTYVVDVDGQGLQKGKNKAQGGKRVMYTTHHICWDAKNRHDLKEELPFDFKEIQHCIPVRGNSSTTQTVTETHPNVPPIVGPTKESPPKIDPPQAEQPNADPPLTEPHKTDPLKTKPEKIDLMGVPRPLADLMAANNVTVKEIQQAVASKNYYPENTPISNYDPNFISGVLVRAWAQVFKMIQEFRDDIPF